MPKPHRTKPILSSHHTQLPPSSKKPAIKAPYISKPGPQPHFKTKAKKALPSGPRPRQCCNTIHRQAVHAVRRLVTADNNRAKGASLKSLTLAPNIENKKATYAVTCQVLKSEGSWSSTQHACNRVSIPISLFLDPDLPLLESVVQAAALPEVPEQARLLCSDVLTCVVQSGPDCRTRPCVQPCNLSVHRHGSRHVMLSDRTAQPHRPYRRLTSTPPMC